MSKILRVFVDTEFTDFINKDLISLGAVTDTGEFFYGENLDYVKAWESYFVKEIVIPLLEPNKYGFPEKELAARFWCWIEELDCDGVIISYDYHGDWDIIQELFRHEKHPKILADENIKNNIYFSCDEITKSIGGNGNDYDSLKTKVFAQFELAMLDYFRRTKEKEHHALSDAQANKEAYMFVVNEFGIKR